jgi:hypothetical protein
MQPATAGSAERDQALAHEADQVWKVSALNQWRSGLAGGICQTTTHQKKEGFIFRSLKAPSSFRQPNQSRSTTARPKRRQSQEALPNPSLKPSPNGKPPGQRYSAGLLLLQRWPGVLPRRAA